MLHYYFDLKNLWASLKIYRLFQCQQINLKSLLFKLNFNYRISYSFFKCKQIVTEKNHLTNITSSNKICKSFSLSSYLNVSLKALTIWYKIFDSYELDFTLYKLPTTIIWEKYNILYLSSWVKGNAPFILLNNVLFICSLYFTPKCIAIVNCM